MQNCKMSGKSRCSSKPGPYKVYIHLQSIVSLLIAIFGPLEQTKNAAKTAVENVLALITSRTSLQEEIKKLQHSLTEDSTDEMETEDIVARIADASSNLEKLQRLIKKKCDILGVDGRLNLEKLKKNKFLQMQINALALKKRIRS